MVDTPPAADHFADSVSPGAFVTLSMAVDAGGRFDVITAPGRGLPEGRYQVGLIPSPATSGLTVDVQLPETRFDIAIPPSK